LPRGVTLFDTILAVFGALTLLFGDRRDALVLATGFPADDQPAGEATLETERRRPTGTALRCSDIDRGMLMLTHMNRCPLMTDMIDRVPGHGVRAAQLHKQVADESLRHGACTRELGDHPPDVRGWIWPVADTPRSPAPTRGALA
jgi:hypothetical protein